MPRGTRKITFSFDEDHLTHFGGMWLIQRFCQKLRLRWRLQKYIVAPEYVGSYRPCDLILVLMFAIILGLRRINKTEILQYNGAFLDMLGLERFPDQTTLRRFLKRLSPEDVRQLVGLHDSLRVWLFELPEARSTFIFDVDSVVLVVYGEAEGAAVGYNPKKRGRRSYHPLFCFESHWHEFWHGLQRPGNAATSTGAIGFLEACLAKVPGAIPRKRVRFRMDSGFFGKPVVEFLDQSGCGYVLVAKAYPSLKVRARRTHFSVLDSGWQYGEFHYRPGPWKRRHRFVVIRRPIPEDLEEAKRLTLFKDRHYVYHIFVTNLDLSPWRVYLFYNGRAGIEKNNREFLYDYPLGHIPTRKWTANVAFFQLLLFAANLVHWFGRLCLPPAYKGATLDTIRTDFLLLPAKLVRRSKKNIVRLPHDYHHQQEFLQAEWAIEGLKTSKKFRFCE